MNNNINNNNNIGNLHTNLISDENVKDILSDIGESISLPENLLSIHTTEIESGMSSAFNIDEIKNEIIYKNQDISKDNVFINKIYNILSKNKDIKNSNNNIDSNNKNNNFNNIENHTEDSQSEIDNNKPIISVDLNNGSIDNNVRENNIDENVQSPIIDDIKNIDDDISDISYSNLDDNLGNNAFRIPNNFEYNKSNREIDNNQQDFKELSLSSVDLNNNMNFKYKNNSFTTTTITANNNNINKNIINNNDNNNTINKYKDQFFFNIEKNKKKILDMNTSSEFLMNDNLEGIANNNIIFNTNKDNMVDQLAVYLNKFKELEAIIKDLELNNKEYKKKNSYIKSKFLSLKEKNKLLEKDLKQTKKKNDENSKKIEKLMSKNEGFHKTEQNYIKTNNENSTLIKDLNSKIRKYSNQLSECKNKEKELMKNISEMEGQIENYENIIESANTKNRQLQESLENAEININSININNDKIKNHMKKLIEENEYLTTNNDSLQKEIANIKESYNSISGENKNLKEKINVYDKESKNYENKIYKIEKESISQNKMITTLTKEKETLNEQYSQLKDDCTVIKNNYNNVLLTKDELEESIKKLKQELDISHDKSSELNIKAENLEKLKNDLESKNDMLDCEVNKLTKANKDLKNSILKLENNITGFESENRDLKFKISDIESMNYCLELEKKEVERQIKYLKIHYNINNDNDDFENEIEVNPKYIETIKNLKIKNNALKKMNLSLTNTNNILKKKILNSGNKEPSVNDYKLNHCRSRSLDSCLINNNKYYHKNTNNSNIPNNKSNQDLVNSIKSLKSLFQNFLKVEMENLGYNKYENAYKQSNISIDSININVNYIESILSQFINEYNYGKKNRKDLISNMCKKINVILEGLKESNNNNQKFSNSVYDDYNKLYLKFKEFIQVFHEVFNLCDEYILFGNSEGFNNGNSNAYDSIDFSVQLKNLENEHDSLLNEYENYKMKMDTDLRDKKIKIKKQLKEMKKLKKSYITQKNTIVNLKESLDDYKRKYEIYVRSNGHCNDNNESVINFNSDSGDCHKTNNKDYEEMMKSKNEEIERLQTLCNSLTSKEAENVKVLLNKIKRIKAEIKNKEKIINGQRERLEHLNKTMISRDKEKEQKNTELQFVYSQLNNLIKSYKLIKQERDSLAEELSATNMKLNKMKSTKNK